MLLGALKGLLHRAHATRNLKENVLEELDLLKDVSLAMGNQSI